MYIRDYLSYTARTLPYAYVLHFPMGNLKIFKKKGKCSMMDCWKHLTQAAIYAVTATTPTYRHEL